MIASLNEPYTRFMPKKDFEDLTTSITSKIYGIGVNIYSNSGKIEVFNVIPSTPADFAQIKQGDIISAVDGKDTNGMNISDVAALVRGPENSVVELTLIRNGKKVTKKIKRKEIKIKNVKSSVIDNHIGYIQIVSFMGGTTPSEFVEALENTKNTDSMALYADAEHLNTDIYSSLTVFIGLICIHYTGIHIIDPILAIVVSSIIFYTGFKICKESVNNLLDGSLPEKNIDEIKEIIKKYNEHGICGIKEIKTRKAGKNKEINITLILEGERTIKFAHDLCDELEKDIENHLGNTEVTIHVEPLETQHINLPSMAE